LHFKEQVVILIIDMYPAALQHNAVMEDPIYPLTVAAAQAQTPTITAPPIPTSGVHVHIQFHPSSGFPDKICTLDEYLKMRACDKSQVWVLDDINPTKPQPSLQCSLVSFQN
jgi:hypothetical protein